MKKIVREKKREGMVKELMSFLLWRTYVFYRSLRSAKSIAKRDYKKIFKRELNLDNPRTLNEKIQWLKLYVKDPFTTQLADKFAVREFISDNFGEKYLIPLLYETTNPSDIKVENMPNCPFIIKPNHSSGRYMIIRNKNEVNYNRLRFKCRCWLSYNYYDISKEWQYKDIKPRRIIVEKLLLTKSGKIPNDYKLHYINGKLQFIYVSYDREGVNDRCLYDPKWNKLDFVWVPSGSYRPDMNTSLVPKPESFDKMNEFGTKIASKFKYVRVDFYDVDGQLYFGEITLHHGGGTDKFFPDKYDRIYGDLLEL